MRYLLRTLVGVCLLTGTCLSAPSAGGPIYQRVICVVPMVGSGTLADPKRPLFSPVAGEQPSIVLKKSKGFTDAPVIVGYHSVLSDDGQRAIVEFVARDRAAFAPATPSPSPTRAASGNRSPVMPTAKSFRL